VLLETLVSVDLSRLPCSHILSEQVVDFPSYLADLWVLVTEKPLDKLTSLFQDVHERPRPTTRVKLSGQASENGRAIGCVFQESQSGLAPCGGSVLVGKCWNYARQSRKSGIRISMSPFKGRPASALCTGGCAPRDRSKESLDASIRPARLPRNSPAQPAGGR